jgi:rod shape determining protein RodA
MATRRDAAPDWTLIAFACALSTFGLAMVYSAGQLDRTDKAAHALSQIWQKQIIWIAVGMTMAYVVSRTSARFVEWAAVPSYALALFLLVLLLFVGVGAGTAASAKSWLAIGKTRIGQPSELAKIAVVLMLAKVLAAQRKTPNSLFELWKPMLTVAVPLVLIMLQPDLGTGAVLFGILFAMLYWSGVSWRLLVLVASPAISLVLAFSNSSGLWGVWFMLMLALVFWYKPYVVEGVVIVLANVVMGVVAPAVWDHAGAYQRGRLVSFLNPQAEALRAGYNVIQSQVAIGSGGWFGKGFTLGTQKRLSFLPQQHTDFIFPVIGEELGFIGVTIALALLCVLLLRSVRIATRSLDPFSGLVALGLVATWCVHVVVNVGMTVGLVPVAGIPLPFFSYGGSFMLACWISVGILVRISASGRGRAETLAL